MKGNILANLIFDIVSKQIKDNDPPEAKNAYDRLIKLDYSDLEATKLVTQCMCIEMFNALKYNITIDKNRYYKNLSNLPEPPVE